ncbi:hypothetical protein EKK58_04670 [Candidatus Dependentiae bacterium]|nr:MAG: hypothetical protein EKK58_04670 [Candidatus Dependentiae bacterium]
MDANNIAETIATILMLNRFEKNTKENNPTMLKEIFDITTVETKLEETKKNALKKIKEQIHKIIDKDIIEIIEKQSKVFASHGKKGFVGATIDRARGWFAKKLSKDKKALNEYKDFEFRHVSPAYTDAAPGLLKNNLEFLYEEICNIVFLSRKVGDLFALYSFFSNDPIDFLDAKIKHIQAATEKLNSNVKTYIEELKSQIFDTKDRLLFFAQQYKNDVMTILPTICTYLSTVKINVKNKAPKDTATILTKENIENFLTFFILPSSFLDTDAVLYTIDMMTTAQESTKKQNQAQQDLALSVKDKIAAQQKSELLKNENTELKKEIEILKKKIADFQQVKIVDKETEQVENEDDKSKESVENLNPTITVDKSDQSLQKVEPATITSQSQYSPSETRKKLLAVQKNLEDVKDIKKLEKIQINFNTIEKPTDEDNDSNLQFYDNIKENITKKKNQYIESNKEQLDQAINQITNTKTLDQLTKLEKKINTITTSSDKENEDSIKKQEALNKLTIKKSDLESKK